MTPGQTGLFTSAYALLLCIPAVPAGLVLGFGVFLWLARGIVEGYTGIRLELSLLHLCRPWRQCFSPFSLPGRAATFPPSG